MDSHCSYEEFADCLQSLAQVNRWFGGYQATLAWLDSFPSASLQGAHLVDVGSGGGDCLREIAAWARERGIDLKLTGLDLNPYAKRAAEGSTPAALGIEWLTEDALLYEPDKPIDLIVSSLMAHHLEDEEIVVFLGWMERTAAKGWYVNDLKRSEGMSHLFGWFARLVGWHRFVQHDGPVSFRRSFVEADWRQLMAAAGMPLEAVSIRNWWPGRLCVGRQKLDDFTGRG